MSTVVGAGARLTTGFGAGGYGGLGVWSWAGKDEYRGCDFVLGAAG